MKGFGPKNHFKEHNKNSNSFESDRLINEALMLHSKGKISDAKKSYQNLIKNYLLETLVKRFSREHFFQILMMILSNT